jgi:hypothetical protein
MDNGTFDDPGDLGFFDEKNPVIDDEAEDNGLSSWVDDVEVVTNEDGSGSFKGKLIGMGF